MAIESGEFVYRSCLEILIQALTNVEALYSYSATHTSWVKPDVTPTPASLQSRFPLHDLSPTQICPHYHAWSTPTPPPQLVDSLFS